MGSLLVRHVRGGCFRLVVVAGLVHLLESGHGGQHNLGPEPTGKESHCARPPRRTPRSWLNAYGAEVVLPERQVTFLDLGKPDVHRGQLSALLRRGHRPIDVCRINLALEVGPVAGSLGTVLHAFCLALTSP